MTIDEAIARGEAAGHNYGRLTWASWAAVLVLKALVVELKRYNDAREADQQNDLVRLP